MTTHLTFFSALITAISLHVFSVIQPSINREFELNTQIMAVDEGDSLALVSIYNGTNGANWTTSTNWLSTVPVSEWYGVKIENGRVIELNLEDNNLSDTIPDEINVLTELESLFLGKNKISYIESLDSLDKVHVIHLNSNQLEGMPSLENLTELSNLYLSRNNIYNLPILSSQTKLVRLQAAYNRLTDVSTVRDLPELTTLSIGYQQEGYGITEIPFLETLQSLEYLQCQGNKIETLPGLDQLVKLKQIRIDDNLITSLPDLSDLKQLETFWATQNNINQFPKLASDSLEVISIYQNELSGTLDLGSFTKLTNLLIMQNQLDSVKGLENLSLLQTFKGNSNNLSYISDFHSGAPLYHFWVQNNQLSTLPNIPANDLGIVYLQNNRLNFDDLEVFLVQAPDSTLSYDSQDSTDIERDFLTPRNTNFQLFPTAGGVNTSYEWFKVGNPTPISNQDTLTFESIQYADSGSYYYIAENPDFPDLILTSRFKHLQIYDSTGNETDSLALVAIYRSTSGEGWLDATNWLSDQSISTWHGITTREIDGEQRVVRIDLPNNSVKGIIPLEINLLDKLEILNLGNSNTLPTSTYNEIEGIVSVDNLKNLLTFNITANKVKSLPSLDALKNLTHLVINDNDLNEIPSLDSLTALKVLYCHLNPRLSVVPDLDHQPDLRDLVCSNPLISSLPLISNPENVTRIWATGTKISGVLDLADYAKLGDLRITSSEPITISSFDDLKSLGYFDMRGTPLGTLPNLDSLRNVYHFAVNNTGLTSFPDMSKMINLKEFGAANNDIPSFPGIENLTKLESVGMGSNRLTSFPPISSPVLDYLSIESNQIPSLPDLSSFPDLEYLNVSFNNAIDSIPGLENLTKLKTLYVVDINVYNLDAIEFLINLEKVQIRNPISSLPDLSNLTKLTDFRLTGVDSVKLDSFPRLSSPELLWLIVNGQNFKETHDLGVHSKLTRLELEYNQLQSISGLEVLPNLGILKLRGNRLNFDQLAPILNFEPETAIAFIPQDSIENPQFISVSEYSRIGILSNAGGEGSMIKWYREDSPNIISTEANLVFNPITNADAGNYYYQATNEAFPGLTLTSHLKSITVTEAGGRVRDSLALVALYHATNGANWGSATNWLSDRPLEEWYGIKTYDEQTAGPQGRVRSINLLHNNLNGIIPAEIGNINHLWDFRITGNQITTIPSEINSLDDLFHLWVNENPIQELPALNGLHRLGTFNVSQTPIRTLPSMDSLENLIQFYGVMMDSLVQFPDFNVQELQIFRAHQTPTGKLPRFEYPETIKELGAGGCNLPDSINLTGFDNLEKLEIAANQNLHTIVGGLNQLSKLKILNLGECGFQSLPDLSNLRRLEELNVSDNKLSEFQGLYGLISLKKLYAYNNKIRSLRYLGLLTHLEEILIQKNELFELPDLSRLKDLEKINCSNNHLGNLPPISTDVLEIMSCTNNRLGFDDLDPFRLISQFDYQPQGKIGTEQFISAYTDSSVSLSAEIDGQNNRYQWYFNSSAITGATSREYIIEAITMSDSGTYHLVIENDDFPALKLSTYTKHLKVYARPNTTEIAVAPNGEDNRVIVEIPEGVADSAREEVEEILKKYGSIKLDSCLCNTLEVWSLPDTLSDTLSDGLIRQYIGEEESIANVQKKPRKQTGNDSIKINWDYTTRVPGIGEIGSPYRARFSQNLNFQHEVVVAVIDYGIDGNHPSIQPFVRIPDMQGVDYGCEITDGQAYSFRPKGGDPLSDDLGHGTHIAGIITELIPNLPLQLMSLKIGARDRMARVFDLACALRYAIDHGAQVINMSVGYQGTSSELLDKLMRETEEKGIMLIASAGNDSTNNDIKAHWPSNRNLSNLISVAAVDPVTGKLAHFSNYGQSTVLLAAPGVGIFSSAPGGGYEPKSGTSIAAASVTAVVCAILADNDTLTPQEIKATLTSNTAYWQLDSLLQEKVISGGRLNVRLEDCSRVPYTQPDTLKLVVGQDTLFDPADNDCRILDSLISIKDQSLVKWGHLTYDDSMTKVLRYLALGVGVDEFTYQVCGTDTCVEETVYIEVVGSPCDLPAISHTDPDTFEVVLGEPLRFKAKEDECGPEIYLPHLIDGAYNGDMWVDPEKQEIVYTGQVIGLDVIYYQMCGITACHRVMIRVLDSAESRLGQPLSEQHQLKSPTLFFPDPSKQNISTTFDIVNPNYVRFQVNDMFGRILASTQSTSFNSGRHTLTLNTASLSTGIYVAHLQIGNEVKTKKIFIQN